VAGAAVAGAAVGAAAVGAVAAAVGAAGSQAVRSVPAHRSAPESSDELQRVTEPSPPVT
jgi:hypothetical protein